MTTFKKNQTFHFQSQWWVDFLQRGEWRWLDLWAREVCVVAVEPFIYEWCATSQLFWCWMSRSVMLQSSSSLENLWVGLAPIWRLICSLQSQRRNVHIPKLWWAIGWILFTVYSLVQPKNSGIVVFWQMETWPKGKVNFRMSWRNRFSEIQEIFELQGDCRKCRVFLFRGNKWTASFIWTSYCYLRTGAHGRFTHLGISHGWVCEEICFLKEKWVTQI